MTKLCRGCNTEAPVVLVSGKEYVQRHTAPCGIVCQCGSANSPAPYVHDELHHSAPWDGPPETDGHYHGECPAGCFKNCCKPPGNLCGPNCQRCFPEKESNFYEQPRASPSKTPEGA